MKLFVPSLLAALLLTACASEMKRGSDRSLYTIAGILEVGREDVGKDIQLTLNQRLLFKMEQHPEAPATAGKWELVDYDCRTLLLLSETPRMERDFWGLLLEARGLGRGEVTLRFTPEDANLQPQIATFEISVHK